VTRLKDFLLEGRVRGVVPGNDASDPGAAILEIECKAGDTPMDVEQACASVGPMVELTHHLAIGLLNGAEAELDLENVVDVVPAAACRRGRNAIVTCREVHAPTICRGSCGRLAAKHQPARKQGNEESD
jgi:hypothetical protein